MDVIAFLADSVAKADGKLYALGAGWSMLKVRSFPARHARLGLGLIVTVPYTETDRDHQLRVQLEDEDGRPIVLAQSGGSEQAVAVGGSLSVSRPEQLTAGDDQIVVMAFNFDGLRFERAGRYRFVVTVDGQPRQHLAFRVTD